MVGTSKAENTLLPFPNQLCRTNGRSSQDTSVSPHCCNHFVHLCIVLQTVPVCPLQMGKVKIRGQQKNRGTGRFCNTLQACRCKITDLVGGAFDENVSSTARVCNFSALPRIAVKGAEACPASGKIHGSIATERAGTPNGAS